MLGFAEQPLVIAGANSVRLPKQHKVGHDAKERLSWALWPRVTWPVSMAARRLSEIKHVSTWAIILSFKEATYRQPCAGTAVAANHSEHN